MMAVFRPIPLDPPVMTTVLLVGDVSDSRVIVKALLSAILFPLGWSLRHEV